MGETTDSLSGSSPGGESKRHEGMLWIWRQVHPRQVIWVFLGVIVYFLNGYRVTNDERHKAVENHIKIQNGTLAEMKEEQSVLKTHVEWIRNTMEEKNP